MTATPAIWTECPTCGYTYGPEMYNQWSDSCTECLSATAAHRLATEHLPVVPEPGPKVPWSMAAYIAHQRRIA